MLGCCGAVIWLQGFIEGCQFTVRTDHDALEWILKLKDLTAMQGRWRPRLFKLEVKVVPCADTKSKSLTFYRD